MPPCYSLSAMPNKVVCRVGGPIAASARIRLTKFPHTTQCPGSMQLFDGGGAGDGVDGPGVGVGEGVGVGTGVGAGVGAQVGWLCWPQCGIGVGVGLGVGVG